MVLARRAGDMVMTYFQTGMSVNRKGDGSPVTLADQASEDIIIEGLQGITPTIPIVAEEQAAKGLSPDVKGAKEYWLVDPLDGTKEFVKGSPDFVINLGLIREGMPVFGMVYRPATGDLYYGGVNLGSFLNGDPIKVQSYDPAVGLTIVGKAVHPDKDRYALRQEFLKGQKIAGYTIVGSSLKFCLIAAGAAHLYPRFVPTYEWDTAAAHAILLAAGGDIIDYNTRQRLQYGKADFLNGNVITGSNQVLKILNP